ncbi:MAG: neuromedin U [Pseudomonadota bacterium]|nr:neuromedin U [Pseudomonadota bacterium]
MSEVQQIITIIALFLILAGSASAQSQEDIAEESMNPLSTVISIPFENNTLFDLGPSNSTANMLTVKPIFPVSVGNWNLINRLLMPIIYTEGQDDRLGIIDRTFGKISWGGNLGSLGFGSALGLGDITYQGFITPRKAGEIAWGLGGSLVLPTHTDQRFGTDKWSAGPAAVFFSSPGNWVLGVVVENIWSFAGDSDAADVNVFSAQIAVNYKLKNRWYLTSSPLISANWEAEKENRWTVPLGGGIGRVFKFKKMAVAIDVGAYYNVESPRLANQWYSQVLVSFLFPK